MVLLAPRIGSLCFIIVLLAQQTAAQPPALTGPCSGFATSCAFIQFNDCETQDGCHYHEIVPGGPVSCFGSAKACWAYDEQAPCESQRGCYWNEVSDEDYICFSPRSLVQVQGRNGLTRMDQLKIGDKVLVQGDSYSTVYSFGHKAVQQVMAYLQVHSSNMGKDHLLEISANHLVCTQDEKAKVLVPAKHLKVGDLLISERGPSEILSIRTVKRKRAYAPLTESGVIQVNGVAVSNYVSRRWLNDRVSGDTLHWLQLL